MNYPWRAVVGLDLSLTSSGVAIARESDGTPFGAIETHRIRSKPAGDDYAARLDRMEAIVSEIVQLIAPAGDALILVEGPSYASTGAGTFDRSGLWWLMRSALAPQTVVVVAPAQRCMYATGAGAGPKASKDAVLAAAIKRYPWLEITGNDVADAVLFMAMGLRLVGSPIDETPSKMHMRAFDKVRLPAAAL